MFLLSIKTILYSHKFGLNVTYVSLEYKEKSKISIKKSGKMSKNVYKAYISCHTIE